MDILKPQTIRIGKRCYRKNESDESSRDEYREDHSFGQAQDVIEDLSDDYMCEELDSLQKTDKGYTFSMDIPSIYLKYIIGKKGESKRQLERETGTQIKIPRQGCEGEIVISGPEMKGIKSAETRINLIVESARQRQPFTHFLSIPATHLKKRFMEFRDQVMDATLGARGLDLSIFQNPNKLHLTLGTLPLMNDKEIEAAINVLQQCETNIIEPLLTEGPLVARFQGLEYMNDDPREVDVLFAKVHLEDQTDRLQNLADQIVEKFSAAGLMQKNYDKVKLHMTVINSLMRKDPSGTTVTQHGQKFRESFDASQLLKSFGEFDFGTHVIETIELSQRYSTGKDGYYSKEGFVAMSSR